VRRRWSVLGALGTALVALATGPSVSAVSTSATEYEVKAAFLFSFAKYIQWPDDALGRGDDAFVIGVLGEDPFGRVLDDTLAGKAILGHPVVVTRFARLEDVARAHILFVGESSDPARGQVLKSLRGRPILSAGESEEFAEQGGIVGFRTQDKKVRFDINLARAEESRLKISSQLLKLATIVEARP